MTPSRLLLPIALATALHLSAAEPVDVESGISAVTVYLDRAEVTRTADLDLPAGEHLLRFDNLPGSLDPRSLRLSGTGAFTLVDLAYDGRTVVDPPDPEVKALTERVRELERSAESQARSIERLEQEREMVQNIGRRYTTPPEEGTAETRIDLAAWHNLMTFQRSEFERIDDAHLDAEAAREETLKELAVAREQLTKMDAGSRRRVRYALARIECAEPAAVALELSYRVGNAGWSPAYDLRVDSEAARLAIGYFGEVRQATGENWDGVQLRLSTAQPMVAGRPPELADWFIRFREPVPEAARSAGRFGLQTTGIYAANMMETDLALGDGFGGESEAMALAAASAETGATAVSFVVERPADIPADNSSTRVFVTEAAFPAHFRYSAVPKLTPHVHLKAKAANATEFPLIAGEAAVFLDNAYVASTTLDTIAPGEEFWVFLGIDQGVKAERRLLEDKGGKGGVVRNRRKQRYAYQFEITNNKARAVELVLWDQLPRSTDDKIKIDLEDPRIDDETVKMNDRGFIEWIFQIKPGTTVEPTLEYTVSYPDDQEVTGLP